VGQGQDEVRPTDERRWKRWRLGLLDDESLDPNCSGNDPLFTMTQRICGITSGTVH
jgi:hypothetical protein